MKFRIKVVIPVAFAALSSWFWIVLSPGALAFLETTQYFPLTMARFGHALSWPGGFAEWLSGFFVQFFTCPVLAGLTVTAFLCAIQFLSWKVTGTFARQGDEVSYPLSFIPSFCAWAFLCVLGSMFTSIVAIAITLGAYLLSARLKKSPFLVHVSLTVLLYHLCGPVSVLYLFLAFEKAALEVDKAGIAAVAAASLAWAAMPFVWSHLSQYPLRELFLGIDYFNQPGRYPSTLVVLAVSVAAVSLVSPFTGILGESGTLRRVVSWTLALLVFAGGWFYVTRNCDPLRERVLQYDRLCLERDWDAVEAKGREFTPVSLPEISAVNLALAKKGKLLDEMFSFPQPGATGLFPDYAMGYLMALTAGEAVYHAGLLNVARHYAFEEYESYPNYHESARHIKRLAEIDMINGNWRLARRYLKALEPTLAYGKWAKSFLESPGTLLDNPEYADLSRFRDESDYLYNDSSDDDKRLALRRIVARDGKRSIASDYLLAYDLLARDLRSFESDVALVDFGGVVPRYVMEAMVLSLDSAGGDVASHPLAGEDAARRYGDYRAALLEGRPGGWIKANFGTSYYYYFSKKTK